MASVYEDLRVERVERVGASKALAKVSAPNEQPVAPSQPVRQLGFMQDADMLIPDDFDTMFQSEIAMMFGGQPGNQ